MSLDSLIFLHYNSLCLLQIHENGNVEKSHQRRSRNFVVLTYWKYAPRVKIAVALLYDFFDHSRQLLTPGFF